MRRIATSSLLALAGLAGVAPGAFADYRSTVLSDSPAFYFRMDDSSSLMENEVASGTDGNHLNNPVLGSEGALTHETPNRAVTYFTDPDRSRFFPFYDYDEFTFEFFVLTAQTPPASTPHWFDGFGLVDAEVGGVTTDAGTALMANGLVGFGMGDPDTTILSTTPINDFIWHHVVATHDGSGVMKLYVDGALERQNDTGPSAPRTTDNISIGSLDTNYGHSAAVLDEVAFYRSELTAADVSEHWVAAGGSPPPPPPPGRLTVFPTGGGRGDLTGPGISCTDIGAYLAGGGDCQEEYDPGTQVTLTPHPYPGSRFSHFYNHFQNDCQDQTTCSFVAQSDVAHSIGAVFHLDPVTLAQSVDAAKSAANKIENGLAESVNPKNKKQINPQDFLIKERFGGEIGEGAATVGVFAPADLIGSDGGSLIGSDGATAKPPSVAAIVSRDGAGLIDSDGGSLIGSDGATLISDKGVGLVGNSGNTRPGHAKRETGAARDGQQPKRKLYVLGRYYTAVNDAGATDVNFSLTADGRGVIEVFGKLNLKRSKNGKKPVALPAALVEVIQPADGRGSGGVYEKLVIK